MFENKNNDDPSLTEYEDILSIQELQLPTFVKPTSETYLNN